MVLVSVLVVLVLLHPYILVELVMIFLVNENLFLTHQTSKLILFDQTGLSIGVG
jgi:hypothetical protein